MLKWAPDGEAYAYSSGKKAVLSTVGGEVIAVAETAGELKSVAFLDNQTMVLGGDDKTVALWDCRTATASVIHQAQPFTQRCARLTSYLHTLSIAGAASDLCDGDGDGDACRGSHRIRVPNLSFGTVSFVSVQRGAPEFNW